MENKIIFRKNNFTIELTQLKIEKTYRNLLCGLPTRKINKKLISNQIKEASKFCLSESDIEIYQIEPNQVEIEIKSKYKFGKPYRLPTFVFTAMFNCYSSDLHMQNSETIFELQEKESIYFEFGLLWFQDNFSIEIPENITKTIIKKAKSYTKG